jgi:hypothetical protein
MNYEIREAALRDALRLAKVLRDEDRLEITGDGFEPRDLLVWLCRDSIIARTGLIEGEIAAMWGLQGSMLGSVGVPWLFTSPKIRTMPLAFYRESRREIAEMMVTRRRLETRVLSSYSHSIRLFTLLGFHVGTEETVGAGGARYRPMVMERA